MFERIEVNEFINGLIKREGGYVNHPNDPGGATTYGWTEANARARGFVGHISDLPIKTAKQWYFEDYWLKPNFNEIHKVSPMIALELFDSGVNVGVNTASEWLQRSLTALNRQGKDYDDLIVDGVIGEKTINALKSYMDKRKNNAVTVLMRCLNSLQGHHYLHISERNQKLEDFTFGWFLHRVVI